MLGLGFPISREIPFSGKAEIKMFYPGITGDPGKLVLLHKQSEKTSEILV
jgi:hypothetical protein